MSSSTEKPRKEKKLKNQIHLRLGEDIVKALENKAEEEGITVTALSIRYMKQGLGWEEVSPESALNIDEIEKRILESLSQQWISHAIELEEKLHKSVAERISKIDLSEIENRILIRVSERISKKQEDGSVSSCIPKLIHNQDEKSLDTDLLKNIANITEATEEQADSASTGIDISQQESDQSNTSIPEKPSIETTPTGVPLLFNLIDEGEVVKPSQVVHYLNQIDPGCNWDIHKLRRLKNKQLTYLKKPLNKKNDEPPLPIISGGYIVDWSPSEAFENLNNTGSSGKSWWVQRLPKDPEKAREIIESKKEKWKTSP